MTALSIEVLSRFSYFSALSFCGSPIAYLRQMCNWKHPSSAKRSFYITSAEAKHTFTVPLIAYCPCLLARLLLVHSYIHSYILKELLKSVLTPAIASSYIIPAFAHHYCSFTTNDEPVTNLTVQ